jgi:hypothetical protein
VYRLVRFWIKTSMTFFVIGLLTGLYMKAAQLFGWPYSWGMVSAHTHVLLLGFIIMMIMGVATWFFPRFSTGPGETPLGWAAYGTMATSTGIRYVCEMVGAFAGKMPWGYIALLAACGQIAAAGMFITTVWKRIRPVGNQT